jgi:hypothetical protein
LRQTSPLTTQEAKGQTASKQVMSNLRESMSTLRKVIRVAIGRKNPVKALRMIREPNLWAMMVLDLKVLLRRLS